MVSENQHSRPGQDSSQNPAQRGLRPARAKPPVITTRLTRTSHVNGLSTTPVAARSSLVWIAVSIIPYSAPVSAHAPTTPWYGDHVSTCYGDAALYEPPPPRTRGTIGRPRVNGQKLASPEEVVAQVTRRRHLTVAW
jgi:hypothetical protein